MNTLSPFALFADELLVFMGATSPAQQEQRFNQLALELFRLQWTHVPAYLRLCEARQLRPGTVSGWQQIPAVPTHAFKEFELTSLCLEDRARVFFSSGTSSHRPSRHFHNAESLRIYEASLFHWFCAHLLPQAGARTEVGAGQKIPAATQADLAAPRADSRRGLPHFIALTPPPEQAPHSSLVHMFSTVSRKTPFPSVEFLGTVERTEAWTMNFEHAWGILRDFEQASEAVLLVGTAFSFVHLLDHLIQHDRSLRLPSGSCLMETGGYKGRVRALPKSELYGRMAERFGVPRSCIVAEYGMSELSSQAYDHVAGTDAADHFAFPPWARVQVFSPETGEEVEEGETGLLRILDLANVYSIGAVQTEDLAVRRGSGFMLKGRAVEAEPRGCSLLAQ